MSPLRACSPRARRRWRLTKSASRSARSLQRPGLLPTSQSTLSRPPRSTTRSPLSPTCASLVPLSLSYPMAPRPAPLLVPSHLLSLLLFLVAQVPFHACLAKLAADEDMDDYFSAAMGRKVRSRLLRALLEPSPSLDPNSDVTIRDDEGGKGGEKGAPKPVVEVSTVSLGCRSERARIRWSTLLCWPERSRSLPGGGAFASGSRDEERQDGDHAAGSRGPDAEVLYRQRLATEEDECSREGERRPRPFRDLFPVPLVGCTTGYSDLGAD